MGEKYGIAKESIEYEGPMKVKEVVKQLKAWMDDKGYGWKEDKHTESVSPKGRRIALSIEGENTVTDYAKKVIKLKVEFKDITDKVLDKHRVQVGSVAIKIDAHLATDYEERWKEDKPALYILRAFFEKYIYSPYASELKKDAREDVNHLKDSIRAYLNLFRYSP